MTSKGDGVMERGGRATPKGNEREETEEFYRLIFNSLGNSQKISHF